MDHFIYLPIGTDKCLGSLFPELGHNMSQSLRSKFVYLLYLARGEGFLEIERLKLVPLADVLTNIINDLLEPHTNFRS